MANRARGVGLSAFQNNSSLTSSYASHGAALRESTAEALKTQLSVFQSLLHNYALEHVAELKSNPSFRAEFAQMCKSVGVDPLAGTNAAGKGKSSSGASSLFGLFKSSSATSTDEWYTNLSVRIIEVARDSRAENGGLIALDEIQARVKKGRGIGGGIDASIEDIVKAIKSLEPLGPGYSIITVGKKQMLRSVPKQLSHDQSDAMSALETYGFVTHSMLKTILNWEDVRIGVVLDDLLADGLVWLDAIGPEKEYWSPPQLDDFDE